MTKKIIASLLLCITTSAFAEHNMLFQDPLAVELADVSQRAAAQLNKCQGDIRQWSKSYFHLQREYETLRARCETRSRVAFRGVATYLYTDDDAYCGRPVIGAEKDGFALAQAQAKTQAEIACRGSNQICDNSSVSYSYQSLGYDSANMIITEKRHISPFSKKICQVTATVQTIN